MFTWVAELWFRLRSTWRRDAVNREMDAEFRFHIERATERNVERGMSPSDARLAALRAFGGVSVYKETGGDEHRQRWLEDAAADIKYAARSLRSHPRFAIASILTVSIAIAANTAVFSVVNGVLLRPLPYPESRQLVFLGWSYGGKQPIASLSLFQIDYVRRHATTIDAVTTYAMFERPIGDRDAFDMARGLSVWKDFFRVTRTPPAIGRAFDSTETTPGGPSVAILTDAFWRTRFGARDDALGSSLELDGQRYTIVGVMPPAFRMPTEGPLDVLLPMQDAVRPGDDGLNYVALTRLKADATTAQLAADLESLTRGAVAERPQMAPGGKLGEVNRAAHFEALGFSDAFVGTAQRTLWILLAAVGFVALIACANVANLLLVRAASREREIAVRATLGAGRTRIVRQLLVECLLVSSSAGALGLAAGLALLRAMLSFAPNVLPRVDGVHFDLRVALFTAGVSILTGLVFGTISAWPGTRTNLLGVLGRSGRGASNAGRRVREILIGAETAIAIVLLAGSGLLITSFARLRAVDPGFDVANVVTARFTRLPSAYRAEGAQWELEKRILADLRATPGVEHATMVANFPLQRGMNFPIAIEGRPDAYEGGAEWRLIADDYFNTFRIPLLRGRDFSPADQAAGARVVIINAAMAQHFWPGEDPLGKRIEIGKWQGKWINPGFGPAEIIGVVRDIREMNLATPPKRTFYAPRAQWAGMLRPPKLAIRATPGARLDPLIEAAVRRVDPRVKPPVLESMREIANESVLSRRFETTLLTLFAATALLLTAIGIYGVIASAVAAQQREIGIRMALGAHASKVVRAIVARGMAMVGGGALVGLVGAIAATRLLRAKLFGVTPNDPTTFAMAFGILIAIAAFAAWIPARRAARVQPADALRTE
jgi:predicted permease